MEFETRIRLANYIRNYITDPANSDNLIPVNTGLEDGRVEGLISQYNSMKLRHDKLIADSSQENPVVVELESSMSSLKQTIISSIDNLITMLTKK